MLRVWQEALPIFRNNFLFLSSVRFKSKDKSARSYEGEENLTFLKPERVDRLEEFIKTRLVVKLNETTVPIFSTEKDIENVKNIFNWKFKKYVFHEKAPHCYFGFQLLEYGARRFLYEQYQFLPEPVKSNAITDLMSLSSLAGFADDLGLSSFLVLQDCSTGKTIPTSSLMNVQNMRLKSEALKLLFAIIAETYSIEVSTSCVKEWIFPHFPHSDYQKIWPKKWLDDYLETNCAITILEKMTKSLRLPNPYYRVVPTIAGPSKRSKATNKIMMKHAALHRVEILLRDFKLEDGLGGTVHQAKLQAARNALVLHFTWPLSDSKSPLRLFYEKHLAENQGIKKQ